MTAKTHDILRFSCVSMETVFIAFRFYWWWMVGGKVINNEESNVVSLGLAELLQASRQMKSTAMGDSSCKSSLADSMLYEWETALPLMLH